MQTQQIKPGQSAIAVIGDYRIPVTIMACGDGEQVKIALDLRDNWIPISQIQVINN